MILLIFFTKEIANTINTSLMSNLVNFHSTRISQIFTCVFDLLYLTSGGPEVWVKCQRMPLFMLVL